MLEKVYLGKMTRKSSFRFFLPQSDATKTTKLTIISTIGIISLMQTCKIYTCYSLWGTIQG